MLTYGSNGIQDTQSSSETGPPLPNPTKFLLSSAKLFLYEIKQHVVLSWSFEHVNRSFLKH